MRRRYAAAWPEYAVVLSIWFILALILYPVFSRARENARRATCMSNQKQIANALLYYAADNNGNLPGHGWVSLITPYVKTGDIFRCPSKSEALGKNDYFFNARFLKKNVDDIKKPQTLVLLGDSKDDSPLSQLPAEWVRYQESPLWRHLEGANYGFADGHIKWLKAQRINQDFRVVSLW
ncbi:hypothetical protein IAD21_03411 [Abditibacteriota bacterium]|nr:hypothetical protein IAD21_03411 [Abditibacteriota bacterium]